MSLLAALIIGGLIGWAVAALFGRDEGVFASIIIGVVGSVIGSFVSLLFTGDDQAALAFSWSGIIWSFIGAVILIAILNAIQGSHRRNSSHL